ncbi:MAG: NUDIX hydrolase [Clostridiales Family XIII bacterium]|jgi:ADP-ribose pyrophosphatase|nr:NUDIX hydrolase [Clostridiales Family XIII bacterium]
MIIEEKTLSSEMVYRGAILNLRKDKVTVKGGRTSYREIVEHSGGVIILGVTAEGRIPMVRQYRKALEKAAFELPAGKLEPGEDPAIAALREFREETGYTAADIRHVSAFYPTVGYSTELLHIYFADGLTAGETDFDENESIEISEHTPEELYAMIDEGIIDDGKSLIALLLYRYSTDTKICAR